MLGAQPGRDSLALALQAADLAADRERPVDEPPLRSRRRVEARQDERVHLLEDARDARQQRRANLWERFCDTERVRQERDREADVRPEQQHQPPVVVGEREVQQHDVVLAVVRRLHTVDDAGHLEVVPIAQHAALRRARGSRRVDDRVEVFLTDRGGRLVERGRVVRRVVTAVRRQAVEVVVGEHVLERGSLVGRGLDLRQLLGVLADDPDGLGVREEVTHVTGRARRVDRDAHRADPREREIEERPVEAVAREQRERVSLANAAGEQTVGIRAHPLLGLVPRDLSPAVLVLDEIRGRRARRGNGVAPQPRDRAMCLVWRGYGGGFGGLGHSSELRRRKGLRRMRRMLLVPNPDVDTLLPMRTSWNGSLSFGLVSIPVGLAPATKPAARQSDVSFRLLHRECSTPIKQKRWCPTHDREVTQDEIVRGFEVAKGQFVIVEDAELEAIERADDSRSIEITRFVKLEDVDPIYFDRTYFLVPASTEAQRRPYVLLLEAMRQTESAALGRFVRSGRESLCLVRAKGTRWHSRRSTSRRTCTPRPRSPRRSGTPRSRSRSSTSLCR